MERIGKDLPKMPRSLMEFPAYAICLDHLPDGEFQGIQYRCETITDYDALKNKHDEVYYAPLHRM